MNKASVIIRKIMFSAIVMCCFLLLRPIDAQAKTYYVPKRTVTFHSGTVTDSTSASFRVTTAKIIEISAQVTQTEYEDSVDIDMAINNKDTGEIVTTYRFANMSGGYDPRIIYITGLNSGNYTISFTTRDKYDESDFRWAVYGFKKYSNTLKIKKKSIKSGKWTKIGTFKRANTSFGALKKIKFSKTNRITNTYVDEKGNFWVYGHKPGKVKMTFTTMNGKKHKKTITVKPPEPDFAAQLEGYDTRNNYFFVEIQNRGVGTLKIPAGGAKAYSYSYKSYDRNLSTNKTITIKPNKSKWVSFYVKGSNTWPLADDFWITYPVSYYGKKYTAKAYYEDRKSSKIKKGRKWKKSYSGKVYNDDDDEDDDDY